MRGDSSEWDFLTSWDLSDVTLVKEDHDGPDDHDGFDEDEDPFGFVASCGVPEKFPLNKGKWCA